MTLIVDVDLDLLKELHEHGVRILKDRRTDLYDIKKKINMNKTCLEWRKMVSGRQKFCSDGCRNAYNNKINKDSKFCATSTTSCAKKLPHSI
jgi:hypothetical protein